MPFKVSCHRILRQSKYKVFFEYHKEVVSRIKEINVDLRKWDSIEKCWVMNTRGLYELIKRYRKSNKIVFDFGSIEQKIAFVNQIKKIDEDDAKKILEFKLLEQKKNTWLKLKDKYENNYKEYIEEVHKNLNDGVKLYPHQTVAAMFLNTTRNALLALDMGTGKTLAAIAYVEMNEFSKVFVITPNSLKFNFYNEVEKFTKSKAHIINWKSNINNIEESKYIIVNYEYFNSKDKNKISNKIKKLNIDKVDCVISDESHKLKSSNSNTFKNFKSIFKDKKISKIFLSGTPAPNKSSELFTVLNQISPIDFGTKKHFNEYYCGMTYDVDSGFGWSTDSTKQKLEELFHKISPYTYRKKKEDILDLPEKIYQNIILELSSSEEKIYNEIEEGVVNEFNSKPNSNPLTIMLKLRQFTSTLKINSLKELINNLLDEDEKIVIVDTFKGTISEIHKLFPEISCLHTGDKSVEERSNMVKEFQDINSNLKIFLATTQTANYGLTLTAASNMFVITQPYSLGEYKQVSDRIHRIGAKYTVNIYLLIIKNTIDEYIFDSLESKQTEVSKTIDNENYVSDILETPFHNIIRELKNKHKEK